MLRFYEVYEDSESVMLVMEKVKGIELSELIDKGNLTEPQIKFILKELLEALAIIHCEGMMHRDLKPSNIIVNLEKEKPTLKILDFGLACRTNSKSSKTTVQCGTPGYIAPEIFHSRKVADYTAKCDIFSIGIILYEM